MEPALAADLQKRLKGTKVGDPARYLDVFAPLRTDKAALSPDGKFLAYTVQIKDEVYVHVVAVDRPEALTAKALASKIENYSPRYRREVGAITWLRWVTPARLVIATDEIYRVPVFNTSGASSLSSGFTMRTGKIMAINADGSDARVLATPHDLQEDAFASRMPSNIGILGLHPGRADSVVVESKAEFLHGVFSTVHGARVLDVLTGKMTALGRAMTDTMNWVLLDSRGMPRITIPLWRTDYTQQLMYQPARESDRAPSLDTVTGQKGFVFAPETILGERSVPLGFDAQSDVLYFASNIGRDTYGIYSLDLKSRERLPKAIENPAYDLLSPQLGTFDAFQYYSLQGTPEVGAGWNRRRAFSSAQLVTDRFTHQLAGVRYEGATRTAVWLRPDLQAVQDWLTANRPGRSAEILEWDHALNRLLVREQGPADAGAFYVLDWKQRTYRQFAHRGPQPEAGSVAQLTPFSFTLPDGSKIDGQIALPRDSKVKRIPLVLLCPDLPWQHRGAEYLPEFEALTRMGLAVAIYNGRGTWGTGIRERQKLRGDTTGVQVADLVAVADHLADKFPVSRKSVALFGQGHGGFTALRALQLQPGRFRCAVTMDAWVYGSAFFDAVVQGKPLQGALNDAKRYQSTPLITDPGLIKAPVFTITKFSENPQHYANRRLHAAIKESAPDSELLVETDRTGATSEVLARQWARIESFLNYVLYNYSVYLHELEILPDQPAPAKQP